MFNLDDNKNENNEEHNLKWPYIPNHPYRMLIIGGPGSGKTMHCLFQFNKRTRYWQFYW